MFETWTVAVFGAMNSASAIWRFVRPAATRASTSCSRAVRPRRSSGDGCRPGAARSGSTERGEAPPPRQALDLGAQRGRAELPRAGVRGAQQRLDLVPGGAVEQQGLRAPPPGVGRGIRLASPSQRRPPSPICPDRCVRRAARARRRRARPGPRCVGWAPFRRPSPVTSGRAARRRERSRCGAPHGRRRRARRT